MGYLTRSILLLDFLTVILNPAKYVIPHRTRVSVLEINLLETWGDMYYLGLTGLQILGTQGEVIDLTFDMMQVRVKITCGNVWMHLPRLNFEMLMLSIRGSK